MTSATLRYLGASGLREDGALAFAPNLARPPVFFDAELREPLRFREAMSALFEVVVGDLRFRARGREAYRAFLAAREEEERALRDAAHDASRRAHLERLARSRPRPGLEADFRAARRRYWSARDALERDLARSDPELFRRLVPCDPIVTVAPDVVLFEGFSKDESSYGCVSIDRESFAGAARAELGTTNVDYSLGLFEHFQSLRTYRRTRLLVDPAGFEVRTADAGAVREEKIELPPSWLRSFGELLGAAALPARRVELAPGCVYALLSFLRRHRERSGPRSIVFRLRSGRRPVLVVEPWGVELDGGGAPYRGEDGDVKVWGRRRLAVLARLLPWAERFDVSLLGSGLPSFWVARLGPARLTLALSGWTTNDWAGGAALSLLAGARAKPSDEIVAKVAAALPPGAAATPASLEERLRLSRGDALGALAALARAGRVWFDAADGVVRARSLLAGALPEVPPPAELAAALALDPRSVVISRSEATAHGGWLLGGTVGSVAVEGLLTADGAWRETACGCSHHFRFRLRKGPCRHLLALRAAAERGLEARAPEARVELVLHLPGSVAAEITLEAERTGRAPGEVLERAFRLAAASGELAVEPAEDAPGAPYRGAARTTLTVTLATGVALDLQAVAARLDRTISAVALAAWRRGARDLRAGSALLS